MCIPWEETIPSTLWRDTWPQHTRCREKEALRRRSVEKLPLRTELDKRFLKKFLTILEKFSYISIPQQKVTGG
jgi:hypothetical protein